MYWGAVSEHRARAYVLGTLGLIMLSLSLGFALKSDVLWIFGFVGGMVLAYIVSDLFVGNDTGRYRVWRDWYFSDFPGDFTEYLDWRFVTGKRKKLKKGKKRKPIREDWRKLINTDGEQAIFAYWWEYGPHDEYREWMYDYEEATDD
jgi:hypothetical protein